jgi:hypothetical protein
MEVLKFRNREIAENKGEQNSIRGFVEGAEYSKREE